MVPPAQSLQWGWYLVNSVTGAQLLPSGKQKRGMACRRRSSSSFWPFSKFSRWNDAMPRVRVMEEGAHSRRAWGKCVAKQTLAQTGAEDAAHPCASPQSPVPASFPPWIMGHSRGIQGPLSRQGSPPVPPAQGEIFSPSGTRIHGAPLELLWPWAWTRQAKPWGLGPQLKGMSSFSVLPPLALVMEQNSLFLRVWKTHPPGETGPRTFGNW